jgi:hypothetical protein
MDFYDEYDGYFYIKCEKCGTVNKKHKTYVKVYGDEIHINPPIECECGNIAKVIYRKANNNRSFSNSDEEKVKCPKCGSIQITAVNRKWSPLTGIFTNRIDRFCLNCKHKF